MNKDYTVQLLALFLKTHTHAIKNHYILHQHLMFHPLERKILQFLCVKVGKPSSDSLTLSTGAQQALYTNNCIYKHASVKLLNVSNDSADVPHESAHRLEEDHLVSRSRSNNLMLNT